MCGIVAYCGQRNAVDVMLQGLHRLEYRGYDSSGICVQDIRKLEYRKKAGRITKLEEVLIQSPLKGTTGISHTRWATHGEPTDANAHPHLDQSGKLAVVHNGVIENYAELKQKLEKKGHRFLSQTDTEIVAHLIGDYYAELPTEEDRLLKAVKKALPELTGTYGLAVLHADHPDEIIGARRGSPLILGLSKEGLFLASDVTALISYTRDVVYLNDFDVVRIAKGTYQISSLNHTPIRHEISRVEWDTEAASRGGHPHYMLKEIFEQPQSLENVLRGRLDEKEVTAKLGGLNLDVRHLNEITRIVMVGCGTALHSGRFGEYIIEELTQIPVEAEFASELRYRNSPMDSRTLVFMVSQSGETADTLAAMHEVQRKGVRAFGIVNVVGSTLARESDGGVYLHAGPEISVAATKSFTSQAVVFVLLGLLLGRARNLSQIQGKEILKALHALPGHVVETLKLSESIRAIAQKYSKAKSMLFLGRQANYPIALEGALKMKEISYISAEAHPTAELKHGIIALVTEDLPSVVICPRDGVYEKNLSNIQEVKARKGPVIAIATEGDKEISKIVDDVIYVPSTHPVTQPIVNTIPLQLLAYHMAVILGCDVDRPRNLAKSVTVE